MDPLITTRTAEETRALGARIGNRIRHPMVIALFGDLGSGKTVFVQGLARGLGVPPDFAVTSPTYILINEYPGRLPLYHADLYRLTGAADIENIGLAELLGADGVVAVEWAERMVDDLPSDRLEVTLESPGPEHRTIRLTPYGLEATLLVEGVQHRA